MITPRKLAFLVFCFTQTVGLLLAFTNVANAPLSKMERIFKYRIFPFHAITGKRSRFGFVAGVVVLVFCDVYRSVVAGLTVRLTASIFIAQQST